MVHVIDEVETAVTSVDCCSYPDTRIRDRLIVRFIWGCTVKISELSDDSSVTARSSFVVSRGNWFCTLSVICEDTN